ncbi:MULTISPECIES: archaellin/type IV pilin N-terminal domain-containing protein [Metallosphaera]|nr:MULTISPECIES: archaellin/type IV pilin N-terminal domain-containing protein [Metallosphaera]MCY0860945.1 type IV pilin [Metallosphaera prunae]QCO29160.1 type IV pilin [Metallosphaera prunae]WPX07397.1 type IV pilin [Metallosphaera sedula DSM 5348]BBL47250.1 hypothetical protein MJ1HA_1351 [Metallosphaera sedula]
MLHLKGKKISSKGRKGLSNIVGSLLMIVLTIVAALLLGHFAFGLFSSNSHNAQISVSDVSLINPGGTGLQAGGSGVSVALTITDTGNDPVNITSITIGGVTFQNPTLGGKTTYVTIQPGQSVSFTATITGATTGLTGTLTSSSGITYSSGTNAVSSSTFNVGSTVVVQVSAIDIVTHQALATQISTVVQD